MLSQGRSCAENISNKVLVLILMFIKLGQCEFFVVHSEGCAENIITGQSGAQFVCEISPWCCVVLGIGNWDWNWA